ILDGRMHRHARARHEPEEVALLRADRTVAFDDLLDLALDVVFRLAAMTATLVRHSRRSVPILREYGLLLLDARRVARRDLPAVGAADVRVSEPEIGRERFSAGAALDRRDAEHDRRVAVEAHGL